MADNNTSNTDDNVVPDWLIPSCLYDVLKWMAVLVIPAVAFLVGTLGAAWGWPYVSAIVTTINAVGVTIGVCIGVSTLDGLRNKRG